MDCLIRFVLRDLSVAHAVTSQINAGSGMMHLTAHVSFDLEARISKTIPGLILGGVVVVGNTIEFKYIYL